MFGITEELERFEALLHEMSQQLDVIAMLLQKLVDQEQEPRESYTVVIDEAQWREWTGQDDRP